MVGLMAKAKNGAKGGSLGQPHDGLVKYAFSKREHAEGLLKSILPRALVALVDWATLELRKDSFIDPELRARYADLLLSARMAGRKVFFYVVVEHQRSVEALMIFRFGRSMVRIWDGLLREEPGLETLPAIVPVLLSNSTAGWTAATKFEDVIDLPEEAREALLPYVPRFEMRLVDLHPAQARGLVEEMLTAFGKLVLWALSVAGDDERFLAEIERMRGAISAALAAPDAHDALFALLRYLSATHERLGAKRIGKLLKAGAAGRQEKVIMDALDELRQEGREEGREEGERVGREEGERIGRARLLLKQLTARFGRVPAEAKAQVLAAKEPALDRWAVRVLTARSLQAVLGAPASRAKKPAPARRASRAARA
jgi:predicted transposase YdaD